MNLAALVLAASTAVLSTPHNYAADTPADTATLATARASQLGTLFGPQAAQDAISLLGGASAIAQNEDAATWDVNEGARDLASYNITAEEASDEGQAVDLSPTTESRQQSQGLPDSAPVGSSAGAPHVCPVAGKTNFIDTWAASRSGGRQHQGTDMFAAAGTPVVAMADGIVVRVNRNAASNPLGGLTVSYVTGTGDRWYNAHLRTVASGMSVGVHITAGTQIGEVGNSGNAATTPPHLHIERHPEGGDAVANYDMLAEACL